MKSPTGKPVLAVDCDLTVCPSDVGWREWLASKYGYVKCPMIEYNFGLYYPHVRDVYEYWRELDYDQFEPMEGSVEKLWYLSLHFDIVFVSATKGNHSKSKFYWLEKWFPFNRGYVATQEKWTVNCIGLIDDRLSNLKPFDKHKRILYNSSYKQDEECEVGYVIEDWNSLDVEEFVKYLKGE